jgi:hypothetical protein
MAIARSTAKTESKESGQFHIHYQGMIVLDWSSSNLIAIALVDTAVLESPADRACALLYETKLWQQIVDAKLVIGDPQR